MAAGVEPPTLHECRHGYASVMDQYGHLLPGAEDESAGLLDAFGLQVGDQAPTVAHPVQTRS